MTPFNFSLVFASNKNGYEKPNSQSQSDKDTPYDPQLPLCPATLSYDHPLDAHNFTSTIC